MSNDLDFDLLTRLGKPPKLQSNPLRRLSGKILLNPGITPTLQATMRDYQLDPYIRNITISTSAHVVRTAMFIQDPDSGVVNPDFRVKGLVEG